MQNPCDNSRSIYNNENNNFINKERKKNLFDAVDDILN